MNLEDKRQLNKLLGEYCKGDENIYEGNIVCSEDCHFFEYDYCPLITIAERTRDEIIDEVMKE